MVAWIKRVLFQPAPSHPILLRIACPDGRPVDVVNVAATWHPSGRRVERVERTAQGLCLISWVAGAERVSLELHAGGACEELTITRDRTTDGRVTEVQLS